MPRERHIPTKPPRSDRLPHRTQPEPGPLPRAFRLKAGHPETLDEHSTFDEAWNAFLQNYAAVNVTAPFKENAFRAADSHDYSALRCRASNLLVKTQNEGIKAYNTDFEAVVEILRQELQRTATANTAAETVEKAGRHTVLVIGCGGAGKAAAAAALETGMKVYQYNRTVSRTQEFADYLCRYDPHGHGSVTCITETDLMGSGALGLSPELEKDIRSTLPADTWQTAHIKEADIIIYTLPGPSDILKGPRPGLHSLPPLHLRPHLAPPPGPRHIPHRYRQVRRDKRVP